MIFLIPIPVIWLVLGVYFLINYIHYRYVKLERFCEAKLERVVRNGAYGLAGFMFETEVNGMRIETETKEVFPQTVRPSIRTRSKTIPAGR